MYNYGISGVGYNYTGYACGANTAFYNAGYKNQTWTIVLILFIILVILCMIL